MLEEAQKTRSINRPGFCDNSETIFAIPYSLMLNPH